MAASLPLLLSRATILADVARLYEFLQNRARQLLTGNVKVNGPRAVRVYAIWAGEENRILFYDSTGVRYAETRLSDAPDSVGLMQEDQGRKKAA